MLHATYKKLLLQFKKPAGTSRGTLLEKHSWIISINDSLTGNTGVGECSIIPGLSLDDFPGFETRLQEVCEEISDNEKLVLSELDLEDFPAIKFGVEMAQLDLQNGGKGIYFDNEFSRGKKSIKINGLIWMGTEDEMWKQVQQKAEAGFKVIKLKIGALNFESEIKLLQKIRIEFGDLLEIRLDANGAFSPEEAFEKLTTLSAFNIHSIEQPIKAGQWSKMAELCKKTPIPIALDEELIGVNSFLSKERLLNEIMPQYIILKPSLLGGFYESDEWIELAEERNIKWWATSALESNLGLTAIAQWVGGKNISLPQGLGTGSLFTNNLDTRLMLSGDKLSYSE